MLSSCGNAIEDMVRQSVRDATGLWTYVLIRGADEAEAL